MIRILDLNIKYHDRVILHDGNIDICNGDVVLLEGANGGGKSTFLKTLLGLERSGKEISGEIYIGNSRNIVEMGDNELLALRARVAYLEQKDYYDSFYMDSIYDVLVDAYANYKGEKLTKADCAYIKEMFEKYMPKEAKISIKNKVRKLSGGQQRLVSIIASICLRQDASVFIIDEPLNNLDMTNVIQVSNLLNQIVRNNQEAIFIIVSHCKIFPFINKVLELKELSLKWGTKNVCNACFGIPNNEGYYE